MHPQLVAERWREIDLWERLLGETRYIGEVGLDAGPRYYSSLPRQTEVLRRVLRSCAQAGGKILSIHSVRAAAKVLDLIGEEVPEGRAKFVFHWFTGSAAEARRAADLGCYFSINSQMLMTDRGKALVSSLPIDRLLTETDGPFTSGIDGPARPRDIGQTISRLATAKGLSSEDGAAAVLRNLKKLMG